MVQGCFWVLLLAPFDHPCQLKSRVYPLPPPLRLLGTAPCKFCYQGYIAVNTGPYKFLPVSAVRQVTRLQGLPLKLCRSLHGSDVCTSPPKPRTVQVKPFDLLLIRSKTCHVCRQKTCNIAQVPCTERQIRASVISLKNAPRPLPKRLLKRSVKRWTGPQN